MRKVVKELKNKIEMVETFREMHTLKYNLLFLLDFSLLAVRKEISNLTNKERSSHFSLLRH